MEENNMEETLFLETIIQPKGSVYILPVVIILIILAALGLMAGIFSSIKNTGISIKDREVVIKSFPYGRKIPIENILVNELEKIDLNQNKEYNISVRTNGVGLPNFHSGWMRLKNKEKALVFLTNKENVLLMPTKDFIVLFSMEKADEFINTIREIKG